MLSIKGAKMQYYHDDSQEHRRRVSDQRAKLAARQRIRQRSLRKLAWWAGIIAVLAVFYFAIGGRLLSEWTGRQVEAVKQQARGLKGTVRLFSHEEVEHATREWSEEIPSSAPPAGQ